MNSITNIFIEIWLLSKEMAPYLLLGFILAGILSQLISKKIIKKHLCKQNKFGVLKGVLFGIPMPICSCGVIPLASALRSHGASKSSTTSFVTSTPQTGIDSALITYDLLGMVITLYRIITAFLSGLICGFVIDKFSDKEQEIENYSEDDDKVELSFNTISKMIHYGLISLPKNISKPLIVGIILSSIISIFIPDNFFINSTGSFFSMLSILIVSMPMYICSTASVPIALAFLEKGISSGAVLVFLIIGPATNFVTITTLFKIIGKKETFVFLITLCFCAIISGLSLDFFHSSLNDFTNIQTHLHCHDNNFKLICVIFLYIILIFGIIPRNYCK